MKAEEAEDHQTSLKETVKVEEAKDHRVPLKESGPAEGIDNHKVPNKRAQSEPPGAQSEPPGAQSEPPGAQSEPPGAQSEPPGAQSEPPGAQSEPPGAQSEPPGAHQVADDMPQDADSHDNEDLDEEGGENIDLTVLELPLDQNLPNDVGIQANIYKNRRRKSVGGKTPCVWDDCPTMASNPENMWNHFRCVHLKMILK